MSLNPPQGVIDETILEKFGETKEDAAARARERRIKEWYFGNDKYMNQTALARLFADEHKDGLCYSYELNRWLRYNGKVWEADTRESVIQMLWEFNYEITAIIKQDYTDSFAAAMGLKSDELEGKKKWLAWAVRQNNQRALNDTLRLAQVLMAVPISEFDKNDCLFNANNGTIDLRTGEIRPHSAGDRITLLCTVDYHPHATYERWDASLKEWLGRPDYVEYLQREFGYCITGLSDEELLIMLLGTEATGKSTFYEPIMEVIGDYGHYLSFSTLKRGDKRGGEPREDLLRLRTSRVVMCSEVNKGTVFDTALVKSIASGEKLIARGIRAKDSVEFVPTFTVVIGTNYQPDIPYDDGGSYRRIKVNPFSRTVKKIDRTLKRTLRTDRDAQERILAWLIEGAVAWFARGLADTPREVERANAEYRLSQNPINVFLEDYCVLDRKAGEGTPGTSVKALTDHFNFNRVQYGMPEMNSKSFGMYMRALGYEKYTDKGVRGYKGIRLKTLEEQDNDVAFRYLEDKDGREDGTTNNYTAVLTYRTQNRDNVNDRQNEPNSRYLSHDEELSNGNTVVEQPATTAPTPSPPIEPRAAVDNSELAHKVIKCLSRIQKEQTTFERQPTVDELMVHVVDTVLQEDNGYNEADVARAFHEVAGVPEGRALINALTFGGDSA